MKLRTKIFIMVLGCVLTALIIQTCLFQNLSSKLIYEQAKEESEQSMQSMQNEIYGLIKGIENNLIEIYMDDELLQSLRKKETIKELQSKFYRKAYDIATDEFETGDDVVNENSTELVVFEAAIDLMSYVDIFTDYESNKLALGMLADAPLETFLREHPQITSIRFCLDGDEPGRKAAAELMRKYYELGYEVEDCPPPAGYKDYNEWLVAAKLNLNRMNKRADEPVRA